MKTQNKELQRQLRLLMLGGILSIIMGMLMLQRPIDPDKEKLGFISHKIGMSADSLALIACGITMIGCGAYKLKRPSE